MFSDHGVLGSSETSSKSECPTCPFSDRGGSGGSKTLKERNRLLHSSATMAF